LAQKSCHIYDNSSIKVHNNQKDLVGYGA